jgi:hypothetical protein
LFITKLCNKLPGIEPWQPRRDANDEPLKYGVALLHFIALILFIEDTRVVAGSSIIATIFGS